MLQAQLLRACMRCSSWCHPGAQAVHGAQPRSGHGAKRGARLVLLLRAQRVPRAARGARILEASRRALPPGTCVAACPEHPAPPAASTGERLGWCWRHGCAPGSVVGMGQAGGSQLLPLEPCVFWPLSCSPSPQPLTCARLCPAGESELLALSAKGRLMTCDLCSPEDADVELTPAEIGRRIKELLSGIGNTSERYRAGLSPPADTSPAPPWAPRWVFGHRLLALGVAHHIPCRNSSDVYLSLGSSCRRLAGEAPQPRESANSLAEPCLLPSLLSAPAARCCRGRAGVYSLGARRWERQGASGPDVPRLLPSPQTRASDLCGHLCAGRRRRRAPPPLFAGGFPKL